MKLLRGLSALSLVVVTVTACNLLKKGGGDDGGAEAGMAAAEEAGAATTPPPAAGAASNEQDIARFPDETKLADVAATVKRPYNVRDAPPAGGIVAGVRPGQGVTQIASRGSYMLITFDDAATNQKLMGWVHKDAFVPPAADTGIPDPKCTVAGETALVSDNTGICGKVCTQDSDCGTGLACHGAAAKWVAGKAGDAVKVCTVHHVADAGAAKPDAGAVVTTVDAGAPPAVVDAGAPKLAPQTVMVAPSNMGVCPDNAVLVKKDNKCHVKCPKAADCDKFTPKGFCGTCDGNRVCSPDRGFCTN